MKGIFIHRPKQAFVKVRVLDKYMEHHKGFIAGGCFKNIFKNQKIKDLDIFFEKEDDFKDAVTHYSNNEDYVLIYENNNATSFKNKTTRIRIELVRSVFGTVEEVLSMFDFSIAKFAYAKRTSFEAVEYYNVFVNTFFEDLVCNKLVIDGDLLYPVSSFERSYRYKSYGYGLCKESKAKLIESLKSANVDNLNNDLYFGLD